MNIFPIEIITFDLAQGLALGLMGRPDDEVRDALNNTGPVLARALRKRCGSLKEDEANAWAREVVAATRMYLDFTKLMGEPHAGRA